MSTIKDLAEQYFRAFHEGDLEQVYSLLSEQAVVKYGDEAPQKGKDFSRKQKI
jgi:ketosteroid isomerase-like protein